MESHNDFKTMVRDMDFDTERPTFYFLNLGETHYPYMLNEKELPRLSGLHGVLKRMDENVGAIPHFFDVATMTELRQQQVKCVEYVDGLLSELFSKCPKHTHLILTADHGELFGENGFFGHGPIWHEKVFEVPFVEGKVPYNEAA